MAADRTDGARTAGVPGALADADPSGERRLVAAILARDRKAAAQFVTEYTDPVYAYVRRRLAPRRDVVDDLVHDVFLAALDGLGSYQGSSSLQAWLLGIARHKVENYYRRQLRHPVSLDEDGHEPVADDPPAEEVLDRVHAQERIQGVLRRLPEAYAVVILWRYWENRSVREIAEASGRTEKAVERLLARARARFRTLWEGS